MWAFELYAASELHQVESVKGSDPSFIKCVEGKGLCGRLLVRKRWVEEGSAKASGPWQLHWDIVLS